MDHKQKINKERGVNFSSEELNKLKDLLEKYPVILNKKTDHVSSKQKDEAWNQLSNEFNSDNFTYRTKKQLIYKYNNMKKIARKELSQEKRERRTTPPPKPSDTSEWICSIMSESIVGLPSTCDSDFIYDNTEIEETQNVALPNVENVTPLENLPVYNEDDIIISTESDTLASVIDAQEKQEKVKFDTSTSKSMLKKPVSKALDHNILPKECLTTAEFILIMDKLFDSFNGHSYQNSDKILKGCLKQGSPHFKFWDEMLPILRSMGFESLVKKNDGTTEIRYTQVPSLKNWIHNITAFKEMFIFLKEKYAITSLLTRNFNQDPLEIFFGNIRSDGIKNNSPTCSQFVNAFKTLLINHITSTHAVGANCERDLNKPLQSLKYMLTNKKDHTVKESNENFEINSFENLLTEFEINSDSAIHSEAKSYVAGYVMKKSKTKICINCHNCNMDLSNTTPPQPHSFIFERDITKKSLHYPSTGLCEFLNDVYIITQTCLRENPQQRQLRQKIIFIVNIFCDKSFLSCEVLIEELYEFITNLIIDVVVHSWCTNVNRILKGKLIKFDINDCVKNQAAAYYKLHKK